MASIPKSAPIELKAAWVEAEKALMRFKQTRDNADREAAATALLDVALVEAGLIVNFGAKVDAKLPSKYRRNTKEMAQEAVYSVLAQERTRMSVLAEKHDPSKATLRTFMAFLLYNKVMDYVRREPIPGLVGGGDVSSELAKFSESLLPPEVSQARAASTLAGADEAQSLGQSSHRAYGDLGAPKNEPSISDNHEAPEILGMIQRVLPEDEFEILVLTFYSEVSAEEGLAHLNGMHGDKVDVHGKSHPYMSLTTYKRKLKQGMETLQARFPEVRL